MECKLCKGSALIGKEYCKFCDRLYFKDKPMRECTTKIKRPEKVKRRPPGLKRPCEKCGKEYSHYDKSVKWCHYCRKNMTEAERWLMPKPEKKKNKYSSQQRAYWFLEKQYGVRNLVVRG